MKTNLIMVAIMLTCSATALANPKNKDLQPLIEEYRGEISPVEVASELETLTSARSALKNKEDLASREKSFFTTETEKTKASIQLSKEQFIKDNVPIEYIISGERAVQQYINDNFVNKPTVKEAESSTVWSSNSTALTSTEDTALKAIVATRLPAPIVEPSPIATEAVSDEMSDDDKAKIEASLAALGISLDEAGSISENKTPETNIEETAVSNVLINKINIQRVTLLGQTQLLDANIFLNVINGRTNRDISVPVVKMSPGSRFSIENVNFELTGFSDKEVVFTNLETGTQFKEWIKK